MNYDHNPMLAMVSQHKRILAESGALQVKKATSTKAEVLRLWPNHTVAEIAKLLGLHHTTITNVAGRLRLDGHDLQPKRRGAKVRGESHAPTTTSKELMSKLWA